MKFIILYIVVLRQWKIGFLRESIRDCDNKYDEKTVTDIIVEDCEILVSSLSIMELAIEKMKTMSDEEIKQRMSL